ncbi:IS66 family insertion sequence element accessory protein TnpB [Candidatus Tisiphia endosymbiont of Parasteatoda lunata]|uniref:IS66 family insertion sequence element accessory protein TnpB n=1 Tax=Candidatus Tisiphia endosymbiont of Parasteatoda lunata TaxID=3066275 RepID=UPI00313C29C5
MLQLTPASVIFVATIAIDFRKGIDGLIAVCRQKLSSDPLNGSLFLFYNKNRTAIKILSFDGQGFWLCSKRLSKGKFTAKLFPSDNSSYQICYRTLHILIHNDDPSSAKFSNDWLPVV